MTSKVCLISNCIDETHHRFITESQGLPDESGCFAPMFFEFLGHEGMIIPLDFIANDILSPAHGSVKDAIAKAKGQFVSAVKKAQLFGADTILLAASTKRLFGDGKELKNMFPGIDFTIGDNGTMISFRILIDYIIELYQLKPNDQIVIGGLGFLGKGAYFHLKSKELTNIFVMSQFNFVEDKEAKVVKSYDEIPGGVTKLFLSCAHTNTISRNDLIRIKDEKIAIIDVAIPHGVKGNVIAGVKGVQRFDGGDFFLPKMICKFHPKLMGLENQGDFYGCFLEATMLSMSKNRGNTYSHLDLFKVNEVNLAAVGDVFERFRNEIFVPISSFSQSIVGLPRSIEI